MKESYCESYYIKRKSEKVMEHRRITEIST